MVFDHNTRLHSQRFNPGLSYYQPDSLVAELFSVGKGRFSIIILGHNLAAMRLDYV